MSDVGWSTPCVMGVINLSSHSFYNALPNYSDALQKAEEMIQAGAAILDVGAVATNPTVDIMAEYPSAQAEIDTLVPFIEALSARFDTVISVDTSRATVMRAAVNAGATMINDQCALTQDNALQTAVQLNVPVCLMHHFTPARKPGSTSVSALLSHIQLDLKQHISRCVKAGLSQERIIIDPGFGGGHFGKNAQENFYLLSQLHTFSALQCPLLIGLSRKSFFGELLEARVEDRLSASIAGAVIGAMKGASIIRVHDVKATVDAIQVVKSVFDMPGRRHCEQRSGEAIQKSWIASPLRCSQ